MKKKILALIFLLMLCICFSSCGESEENTGVYITPDDIEDISEKLGRKEIIYEQDIDNILPIYYWSENGSVFHTDNECPYLSNSSVLICGNIDHVYNYGISKACSKCFG